MDDNTCIGARPTDQALVSDQAPTGLAPSGFDPSRIPWHIGASDESYGTLVWYSRVENLRAHLRIIRDYLPDDCRWLAGQVSSAIRTADGYLRNWSPLCDSDGSPKGGDGEAGSVHDSADPKGIARNTGESH